MSSSSARSEKSIRNMAVGLCMTLANILTGFITRTVLIRVLGVTIAGMSGLFTEVIAMLSMAELGIGSAITYHLYKPIVEHDENRICQLMSLYRKTYHIISAAVLVLGVALTPVLPYIIKDVDLPIGYINTVYLMFVLQTSLSYLMTYKTAIFEASQDQFWISLIRGGLRIVICAISVLVINLTRDYVLYMVVYIADTLIGNLLLSILADKKYPFLKRRVDMPKAEQKAVLSNVRHMFVGRLSGRITNSTDNILISTMVSTIQVGYYSNYSMILSNVRRFADQIGAATVGSIGNMLVTEDGETCSKILKRLTLAFYMIGSSCACVMMACLTPVVILWLGADFVMEAPLVFVCVLNFFLIVLRSPVWSSLTPSGLFKQTKYASIIGTVLNLIASILFTLEWGMIGIFIGTTLSIVVQLAINVYLIWNRRLKVNPWEIGWPLLAMIGLGLVQMGAGCALYLLIHTGSLWLDLALLLVSSAALSLLINVLVFSHTSEFDYLRWLARKMLGKFLGRVSRGHKAG